MTESDRFQDQSLHLALADAKALRDLRWRQPLHPPQQQRLALQGRQGRQRILQRRDGVVGDPSVLWTGRMHRRWGAVDVRDRAEGRSLVSPKRIHGKISCSFEQERARGDNVFRFCGA